MWARWVGEEEARLPTRCRSAFAPTKAAGGLEPLKKRLNRALIAKERLSRALRLFKRLKEPEGSETWACWRRMSSRMRTISRRCCSRLRAASLARSST